MDKELNDFLMALKRVKDKTCPYLGCYFDANDDPCWCGDFDEMECQVCKAMSTRPNSDWIQDFIKGGTNE